MILSVGSSDPSAHKSPVPETASRGHHAAPLSVFGDCSEPIGCVPNLPLESSEFCGLVNTISKTILWGEIYFKDGLIGFGIYW